MRQYLRVAEETYKGAQRNIDRWHNGDETDSGIVFPQEGDIVHFAVRTEALDAIGARLLGPGREGGVGPSSARQPEHQR